jgi:predicted GNAT superfamily acetyltransferase
VPDVLVRTFVDGDIPAALALNNASVPDLNELDESAMRALLAMADAALVAEVDGRFAGFCWVMRPGQSYASENYVWFSQQYDDFVYLDRITVMPDCRRLGVGRALYAHLTHQYAGVVPVLTCEVNLVPRNDNSLRFHAGLGFVEVGQQHTGGGAKQVSLLALEL